MTAAVHADTVSAGGAPSGQFDPGSRTSTEVVSLRTRTSRTFEQNGTYQTEISVGSLNYKDAAGNWQPIDNSLVPTAQSGFAQQNGGNRYKLLLPSNIGHGPVKFQTDAGWVQFEPVGQTAAGQVHGNDDTFQATSASFDYLAESDAVKETITLPTASAPSSYTFNLQTSNGLTAQQNGQGGIDFVDNSGSIQFSFTPPFTRDAAGVEGPATIALSGSGGNQTVTLAAEPSWLADPNRQWPVVIDPTISLLGTSQSTICGIQPAGSQGPLALCGPYSYYVGGASKMLVRFDMSSIPANVQLLNAKLQLSQYGSTFSGGPYTVGIYPMSRAWTTGATWTTYDATNSWTMPGGDFSSTMAATNTVTVTTGAYSCPNNACTFSMTNLAQNWLNGTTPNYGVAVRDVAGGTTTPLSAPKWWGSVPNSSYAPQLILTYNSWTGDRSFYTETSAPLTDQLSAGVNVSNGNLLVEEDSVTIPGTVLDLSLDEYYNNLGTGSGPFGNGWTFGTAPDVGLQIDSDGSANLVGPTGYYVPFIKNADGTFATPAGIDSTLVKNSDGTYALTEHGSGETYTFSSGGFLLTDKDVSGNTITASYANNLITSLSDTQGRQVTFTYGSSVSSSLVSQITDSAGRTYGFTYDTNKNLTAYTDPNGKVAYFAYDGGDNLNQITDPNGNVTAIAYDTYRRVTSITRVTNQPTTGAGATTTYTYNPGNTVVSDSNSHATTYSFDAYGRTLTVKDPSGNVTHASWNTDDEVTQTQSPNGGTTTTTYNGDNVPTQVTEPSGAKRTVSYTATNHYLPTSVTDPLGHTSTVQYNAQNLPTVARDPLGSTTTQTYNANGTPNSVTTPTNATTSYSYDTKGRVTGVTPPSGSGLGTPTDTYNTYGMVATSTDGDGNVTSYTYDKLDRVTASATVSAKGSATVSFGYIYDADGNLTSMADSSGTTSYTYNALNQQVTEQTPSMGTNTYTYDGVDDLLTAHDGKLNRTTTYTYNPLDLVASVKDSQGNTTTFGYDKDGNKTVENLPSGVIVSMTYDSSDNLTGISAKSTSGSVLTGHQYAYSDPATGTPTDYVTQETAANGSVSTYTHDADGQILECRVTSSNGGLLADYTYTYYPGGNIHTMSDGVSSQVITYDSAGQVTNDSVQSGGNTTNTTYSYDADGNETSSSDGFTYTWDAASQMNVIALSNGTNIAVGYSGPWWNPVTYGMSSITFDATGETSETTSSGTTSFTNTPDGTPISETTPSGTYYYIDDGEGSVDALLNGLGAVADTYNYDPLGNITTETVTVPNPFTYDYGELDPLTDTYLMPDGSNYDATIGQSTGGMFFADCDSSEGECPPGEPDVWGVENAGSWDYETEGSGDLRAEVEQLKAGIRSTEKTIAEHEAKLAAYKAHPDLYDNRGFYHNAPSDAIREQIYQGRIRQLEKQIANQRRSLASLEARLRRAERGQP
jgi:YD repeat-containing protein